MWYIILLFFVIDYYSTQIMRLVTWKEKRDYKALGKKCSKILKLVMKAMAPHSSTLAWRIPGVGEPGGLTSMGSQRVRHD